MKHGVRHVSLGPTGTRTLRREAMLFPLGVLLGRKSPAGGHVSLGPTLRREAMAIPLATWLRQIAAGGRV